MGNVLHILLRDLKRLLKAPAALIVAGALLVLPSLYTWYNVVAFWNPYEATGGISVCVVNQDAGTTNDMTGQLDIGNTLVEQLRENDQLNWITDKDYDTAMEDLKAGNVYAVYVVPEDFSASLVSPLTGELKDPRIEYYANEKLGPVSPKVTDTAASTLGQTINSTFVSTVAEVATQAVDDALVKAESKIAVANDKATGRADEAKAAIAEVRQTLTGIAGTLAESRTKVSTADNAIAGASMLTGDTQAVIQDVTGVADALQSSLSSVSADTVPALSNVLAELSQATAKANALADALASSAGTAQADVDLAAAKVQPVIDTMRETAFNLEAAAERVPSEELAEKLRQAGQDMTTRADEAQETLDGAVALAERIESATQTGSEAAKTLNDAATRASDSFAQYASDLYGSAASSVNASVVQINSVCARLSASVTSLDAALGQLHPVLSQLDGILANCESALTQSDALIGDVQADLDAVMADVRMLAKSDILAHLTQNGTLNAQNIAEFMGSPTELSTIRLYHPNVYGTAMAPLFMNLTFWIGAFMLVIIFLLEVDSEGIEGLKPWQRYLGRFLLFSLFVVAQAVICCAGTLALGVQAANVPAFFVAAVLAALAFLSIIYALSATFRHVGKGLCIVLVFAQIPGASGLYPVEMTSSFFQAIYPFLPFTYGIDAMRESIGGFYGVNYAHDLIVLGVFFFASLALGLLLGPLMSNVVRLTARQVYEGDLYTGEDVQTPERPYRLAHVLRALSEKESYREELERRYSCFTRRYPLFIRGSIIFGVGVPVVIGFLLALDAAEKVTLLTFFLLWLIALIGFLVVVESQRYSFERQLNLESMSEDRLLRIFADRNLMVRANTRLEARRKAAAEAKKPGSGDQQPGFKSLQIPSRVKQKSEGGIRNIGLIARRDLSALFKNVMSVVLTVGLVVLPSLFAWYNVLACWNVFDNTNQLSVAVACKDAGYESDLMPINVNVGEKVVSALRANDQIHWVFTDADGAVEGVKAGNYYAALVIPENFSRNMLTFYEGDSRAATIDYYVNEKKNAIAPNITGIGADTVSEQVNVAFANTIADVAISVAQSISNAAEEGAADSRIASLAQHMSTVAGRLDQSANVLHLYSSVGKDAQAFIQSGAEVVASASDLMQQASAGIDADKVRLRDHIAGLSDAVNSVNASLDKAESAVKGLEQRAESMTGDISGESAVVAGLLRDKASDIDEKAAKLTDLVKILERIRDTLKSAARDQLSNDVAKDGIAVELSSDVAAMVEDTIVLDKDIAALKKAIDILQKASASCTEAADDLEAGTADIEEKAASLRELVSTMKADAASVKENLQATVQPEVDALKADLATLVDDLDRAADELQALNPDLPGTLTAVATSLGDASLKVDEADAKLHAAAQRVRNLADAIDGVLATGDIDKVRSLLQEDAGDLAAALTSPVKVERTVLFPSDNFGSAMTPLYCTLALFIGSLLIMVVMKPEVSSRGREKLVDPKPRHLFFGRFIAVAAVSLMQTTLLALGNMLLLKVQVVHPLLFMLGFWFSGLVLAFMIYTLVVAFGNLGKAIAVLLLIVQVTACGGSFPLQMLPDFVQAISPWVPATYIVDMLQSAMMGVYHNDFWVAMGKLALFIIPFLLLGLVLRKPMVRFMRFYVSKVEECGIMG